MGKVRTITFKKIYDLHKQVQIADTIELERERNHNNTKITRQLNTLNNYITKMKNGLNLVTRF